MLIQSWNISVKICGTLMTLYYNKVRSVQLGNLVTNDYTLLIYAHLCKSSVYSQNNYLDVCYRKYQVQITRNTCFF